MICYLIDDDEDDRDFLEMALKEIDSGIKLLFSDNADDAFRVLRASDTVPNIIFLDLNMPRIDGWECLKRLKETTGLKDIPVIIYSTSEYGKSAHTSLGYEGFLTKQSKISDLVVRLREIFIKVNI